jgi:uncharacterized membrane protein (UPF0127 family)
MERMRRGLALALLVATSCASTAGDPGTEPASLVVTTDAGPVALAVEVADTPEERATGLMGREDLAPYDGMVFSWTEATTPTFWMKNTLIPLSIAFWDEEGRIVRILDMEPCQVDQCPTYEAGRSYTGAVEVEQGSFDELEIEVGDRVELVSSGA